MIRLNYRALFSKLPEGAYLIPSFELTLAWMALDDLLSSSYFVYSSSTVSGGGITLLSSNSATTLGGRNDPSRFMKNLPTSAIVH